MKLSFIKELAVKGLLIATAGCLLYACAKEKKIGKSVEKKAEHVHSKDHKAKAFDFGPDPGDR